jgi:hypothetical protein
MAKPHNDRNLEWLEEFQELANAVLNQGSAHDQVHPVIATWYDEIMADDPPDSRDSVWQAMHCLTTEVMNDMPEPLADALESDDMVEVLGEWVFELLLIGRAMQIALDNGRLDDL